MDGRLEPVNGHQQTRTEDRPELFRGSQTKPFNFKIANFAFDNFINWFGRQGLAELTLTPRLTGIARLFARDALGFGNIARGRLGRRCRIFLGFGKLKYLDLPVDFMSRFRF